MISNAGSHRRGMPLAPGLALLFGLALSSQSALAGVNEAEAGLSLSGSELGLVSEAQSSVGGALNGREDESARPIVVAEKLKITGQGKKNWNKNYNKNWSKNYKVNKKYVVTKKVYVQPWYRKPHYGQFFGGVVLGSILTAAAVGVAPPPPSPELCWYWLDPYRSRGYWDYCPPPY